MNRRDVRSPEAQPVVTLLGHGQVTVALECLGSLLRCASEALRLRVHDDGTLTVEDREHLVERLGVVEFLGRGNAEDRLASLLSSRPHTRRFRDENPLALKLVDAVLLAEEEVLAFCDADVLFLRPFEGLFSVPPGAAAIFMADVQNAYSVRSWHLLRERRLQLPRGVNTGIVLFERNRFDLDFVEWFLGRERYRRTPVWVEQTLWALLGHREGCRLVDPMQIQLAVPREELSDSVIALHFVSPRRYLLAGYLAAHPRGGEPVPVRTVPCRHCAWWNLASTEARRWLQRLL